MKVGDLETGLVEIHPYLWALAIQLGNARKKSNDGKNGVGQDRGDKGNKQVHVQGAFGELLTLRQLDKERFNIMVSHLFDPNGGRRVEGADVELSDGAVDVKSFDCASNKNFFLVNKKKHAELVETGCSHYYCVLSPPRAKKALALTLPLSEVSRWPARVFGTGNSMALFCGLDKFFQQHHPSLSVKDLRAFDRYSKEALEREIRRLHLAYRVEDVLFSAAR